MFIYEDNDQLKKELKKLVIDSEMTQKEVAEKMEVKPQQYTNIVRTTRTLFLDPLYWYKINMQFITASYSNSLYISKC